MEWDFKTPFFVDLYSPSLHRNILSFFVFTPVAEASDCASQVKLDVYLAELTKIGKSQKYTLSVDVEGGRLVVMKKVKDNQEDWTTFTHDKSRN